MTIDEALDQLVAKLDEPDESVEWEGACFRLAEAFVPDLEARPHTEDSKYFSVEEQSRAESDIVARLCAAVGPGGHSARRSLACKLEKAAAQIGERSSRDWLKKIAEAIRNVQD